ncbi:MAG TPA: polysaccharide biosynthesis/export family protein [Candidatus Polarisedimenticolia bacterium]|nr:polysaccharide biosynthesis/export family protein [Candidatus Polarisedimenticolia bacterium]
MTVTRQIGSSAGGTLRLARPAFATLSMAVLIAALAGVAWSAAGAAEADHPAGARGTVPTTIERDVDTAAPESAVGAGLAAAAASADHPVGPEDLLEISVFEIPELNRTVRVSEKGTISLPLLGEMEVRGLTSMQLESRLREALTKRYLQDPQVSVFVREYGSKKVSVIGAVGKPGVYAMLGPRTLLQVLSEAGGLVKEAGAELYVIRAAPDGASEKIAVKVNDLLVNRDPALNLPIEPGDVISVPLDRPIYIYVDGAVKTPGRLEELANRPITLLQAIAKAGGTTERANLKAIQVLRRGADGTQSELKMSLKRIRQGRDPDPLLQEGDVIVVPETFF